MASATRSLVVLLLLLVPAVAGADGALYLERFTYDDDAGVARSSLYVYTDSGLLIHSGRGSGSYDAGVTVPVAEGWYWVEVGQYRTEHNLQRLYVADGQTTVVPSGWVAVRTEPRARQPRGCDQWNAELTAFKVDASGREFLVASNRGTGADGEGMLQLPVGDFLVYFNSFPVEVTIQAGQIYRLPTGFQGPVAGQRPQLALRGARSDVGLVRSLCETGETHVPAGDYWVSRIVPTNHYPYEERVRDEVTVPPDGQWGYTAARVERVRNRYEGTGSYPEPLDGSQANLLADYRRGAVFGSRSSGFEGALPGLDF
jgi:hypothetical protein